MGFAICPVWQIPVEAATKSGMLVLATILDNPGEPPADTRYRDLTELRKLGYTGLVAYQSSGLSGLMGPDSLGNDEMRRWVGELYEQVERLAGQAYKAGLDLWLNYDAPALAGELVGAGMTCVRQSHCLCPASDEMLARSGRCLEDLLNRVENVEGVVLRLGDSDAHRLDYLIGNDIYAPHCARCNRLGAEARLTRFVQFFYDLVVHKLERKLIVRAWNIRPGGLHDDADLCGRVMQQLPEDDRLILSFKFTHADFWRYQRWNPSSLVCGDRPIIYELQCQREYEGKGALPNYQAPLWAGGMPEVAVPVGLAEASRRVNLAGLWAWVRGGGWQGPYLSDETWIDANVFAVPHLARNPAADPRELARQWIDQRLGCKDATAIEALLDVLDHSPTNARETFYIGPYARGRMDPWYPSGDVVHDDVIDAEAAWSIVQRLPDSAMDEAVAEKQRAAERLAGDRRRLAQCAAELGAEQGDLLIHSLKYAETLAQTLGALLEGLARYRRSSGGRDVELARAAVNAIRQCQDHWTRHQRTANHTGTATAFRSDNLWEFTQRLLEKLEQDK